MALHNKYDKNTLRKKLESENFKRSTVSFYRYVLIAEPEIMRDDLFREWNSLGILGRVYVAKEGINAQINIPAHNVEEFKSKLDDRKEFQNISFKWAVEDDGKS